MAEHIGRPFRKGGGCPKCHDSGFKGRMGIYEVMTVTPGMRRLIHKGASSHELRDMMRASGEMPLRLEGIKLALANKSSLEEVLGVTHSEDDDHGKPTIAAPKGVAA